MSSDPPGSTSSTSWPATTTTAPTSQASSLFPPGYSLRTSNASASASTTRPVTFGSGSTAGLSSGSLGGGFGTIVTTSSISESIPAGGLFSQQNSPRVPSPSGGLFSERIFPRAPPRSPQPSQTTKSNKAFPSELTAEDFSSVFTSPIITIKFSRTKKQYRLHQDVLVSKSGYFKHMLSSGLREQHEGCVDFRYTEPFEIAFRSVIQFMYHGDYRVDYNTTKHALGTSVMADHIFIYVLADRLIMPELKSLALAKYIELTASDFNLTFDHLLEHIPFLVPVLYDDLMEEENDESDAASTEQSVTAPLAKQSEEQQGEHFDPIVEKHASDVESDPRRGMQKAFVKAIHRKLASFQDKTIFRDLICEGGPFVLDLFMPMQVSEPNVQSHKRKPSNSSVPLARR